MFCHKIHRSLYSYLNSFFQFDLGEYVVISSTSRLAVAAGFIVSIEARRLDLRLERDLSQRYSEETFIIDKHDSQSFATFNFTNLGMLLSEENASRS